MDTIETSLTKILRKEVSAYAGEWLGIDRKPSMFYYVENPDEQIYCVLAPQRAWRKQPELVMMARIVNNQIIIDLDKTDKPLREALQKAGITDDQIIVAD